MELIVILLILFVFGVPIWAIVSALSASGKANELGQKIETLESDLAVLRHRIWKMETEGKPSSQEQVQTNSSTTEIKEMAAGEVQSVPVQPKPVVPIPIRVIDPLNIELASPEIVPDHEKKIDITVEPIVHGEPFILNVGGKDILMEPIENAPEPVDVSTSYEPAADKMGQVTSEIPQEISEPIVFNRTSSSRISDFEDLSPLMQWMKTIADTNIFVKIGVGLLFVGLSFFLKYAVDHQLFLIPMEIRVGAVALTGIGLTVIGSRMKNRRSYGLILQGAGMGIFYLTTFAAFRLFGLIEPVPALILMVVTGITTAILAIKNNEPALAMIAILGGFSAPILAPSENPSHIVMFSYYLLVNLAIFGITALRPWWVLGSIGFVFTFIISTLWGVTSYDPSKLATTEPFLILYWIIYIAMALFYELRRNDSEKTVPASLLLFGVPTVAFSLQMLLMKETLYGVSISAIVASIVYAVVFMTIRSNPKASKSLSESIRTISIVFFTLAFPFALAPVHTSTAWAIEGAVLLTIALKQSRKAWVWFGAILQLAAMICFLGSIADIGMGKILFVNSFSFSAIIMVITLYYSSYKLRDYGEWILFITASVLLLGSGLAQLEAFISPHYFGGTATLYSSVISMLFLFAGLFLSWSLMRKSSLAIIGVILSSTYALLLSGDHLFSSVQGISIIISVVLLYVLLTVAKREITGHHAGQFHSWILVFLTVMFTRDLWLFSSPKLVNDSAKLAVLAAVPLMTFWATLYAPLFPFDRYRTEMQSIVTKPIAWLLLIWSAYAFCLDGSTAVPYIPILNPLDLIQAVALFATIVLISRCGFSLKGKIGFAISMFVFLWIMVMVLRVTCGITGITYDFTTMIESSVIQAVVTIYSALYGTAYMIVGSKRGQRSSWMAGSVLLGLVTLKLIIDLVAEQTLARITTFIVVSILFILVQYFAPFPSVKVRGKR